MRPYCAGAFLFYGHESDAFRQPVYFYFFFFKIENWLYLMSDPVGQTKRQYGRMITVESATKVMAMAMTTHDADWNTKAEKGS